MMGDPRPIAERLKSNISDLLPHLSDKELEDVVNFLLKEGVRKDVDLYRMTIPILKTVLTTVDASDLYEAWQTLYGPGGSSQSRQQQSQLPLQSQQETSRSRLSSSGSSKSKVPMYDKDHVLMPTGIQEAIRKECRPSSKAREAMVERFVDDCRKNIPNLQRSDFVDLADFLVQTYPATFKDTVIYTNNKLGSDSLRDQFRNKFDNDKRNPNVRTSKELEAPARPEAYGCISWNPQLPASETEASQEEKRITLLNMSRLAKKNWDQKTIKKLMMETYYLQRKDINGEVVAAKPKNNKKRKRREMEDEENESQADDPPQGMNVSLVRERWPFLFTSKGMNQHCKTLTGTDFHDSLYEWINSDNADILIDLLATKSDDLAYMRRRMVREEKKGNKTAEIDELDEELFSADGFPNLVVAGTDLYSGENFFFCCDHTPIVCLEKLFEAIVVLLSSYFVLNVMYATDLACTLIFLQEQILKLKGTNLQKCVTMDVQRAAYKKVSRFTNKFLEFAEKWRREEGKENEAT
ncbi:Enolase 1 [Frankliniella fusca]|uniref:Enolase 1 n=1 Tax=Frankliniella fusca TaxID=407009 RepID=A0AAE1LKX9_9NEOP|nr:Enolase 1 [Frankliniella fusca]